MTGTREGTGEEGREGDPGRFCIHHGTYWCPFSHDGRDPGQHRDSEDDHAD